MWTAEDYSRHAQSITQAYCAAAGMGGATLESLVEKTARDSGLVPEQIRRLSRMVNTETFNAKYAALKGSNDRKVQFDPVDAEKIINTMQTPAVQTQKTASANAYPDLPDPRAIRFEKKASAPPVRTIDPEVRLRHLLKLAADIPLEMTGLDIRWQSAIKHVASLIDHDGFDKVSMEKNALAVLGLDVLPELNAIRDSLKLPMLDMSREKFASIEDRLIGSETPITEKLREARTIRTAYAEKSAALAATRDQLAQARQEVRRG
jgi:hypothetical protein